MTPPTPTRADVLREYKARLNGCDPAACLDCADTVRELMADELLRLRTQRDAMIRRVETMPAMALATAYGAYQLTDAISRADVLAALREGGDA